MNAADTVACPGRIFIVSAPSGAGKTTLCREVRRRLPELRYSVSHTTRPARAGEIHGRDYFFVTVAEFQAGIAAGEWAEWAEVHGNYYGTSALFIDRELAAGHDLLLDIDTQGAAQMRKRYPHSITIFIMPPSVEELARRLTGRGTDSAEVIAKRLRNAEQEMAQNAFYDHIVINDKIETAVQELLNIIAPKSHPSP